LTSSALFAPLSLAQQQYCKIALDGTGVTDAIYSSLAHELSNKNHVICPFDWREQTAITAYFSGDANECHSKAIAGIMVGSVRMVSGNDLNSGLSECKSAKSKIDAYFWVPSIKDDKHMRQQAINYASLHKAILFSGLPFSNDVMSNVGICFEEPASVRQSPSVLFGKLGLPKPTWMEESVVRGETCDTAIDQKAKSGG
jgi:hypothetical protein